MDSSDSLKVISIFVSSPGDVGVEREKAREIFTRLGMEFSGVLVLKPYFWEHELLRADTDFQGNIPPPSQFDIFVCLLWSRLGSRLHPALHRKPDGSAFSSGTEFEIVDALSGYREKKAPEIHIYKRSSSPILIVDSNEKALAALEQKAALDAYWISLTRELEYSVLSYKTYKELLDFEAEFEADMRKLLLKHLPKGVKTHHQLVRSWTAGSPFRGLSAFDFEHAAVFFGRTQAIDQVVSSLKMQAANKCAFVLIYGASGSGKSSLARAGVLPLLVKPGVVDGIGVWRRAVLKPGDATSGDLFELLASTLLKSEALPELCGDGTTMQGLAEMLRNNPEGIGMLIKGALSQVSREVQLQDKLERQPRALLILLVDQMEEIFTTERIAGQREPFFRVLRALSSCGYVWVLATLRSDFYPRCEESPTLMQLKGGDHHLAPADGRQLGQMIRLPAAAAGLQFEHNFETGECLDDILRDAAKVSPNSLPLLEFALEQLFLDRDVDNGLLRLSSYREMQGVEGALGKRAEESFNKVGPAAQAAFNSVFRKLVTITTDKASPAVRRRALKDEIESDPGCRELANQLINDRLLVADRTEDNIVYISVAHEAMLRSWQRLVDWIANHRESLKNHAEVTADSLRWTENARNPDFLYASGVPLDRAKEVLNAGFLDKAESEFVIASLRKVARQQFLASLTSGQGMLEESRKLQQTYPDLREAILHEAVKDSRPRTRVHVADLLGMEPIDKQTPLLISLLMQDPSDAVREAAADSLIKLDKERFFQDIVTPLGSEANSGVIRAMAYLRAAADAVAKPTSFEKHYRNLSGTQRSRVFLRSKLLRLLHGWPTLFITLIPSIVLSSIFSSVFKAFPGSYNWALCQAEASAMKGAFAAIAACFFWGGTITFAITLHRILFRSEQGPKSYLQPASTLLAGALGGAIGSGMILFVMANVYDHKVLKALGWIDYERRPDVGNYIFFTSLQAWPYLIMGVGLGVGMALMANGVWASSVWASLMAGQSQLTGKGALMLTWRLMKSLVRYGWPIVPCMALAGFISLEVVQEAASSTVTSAQLFTWKDAFSGGLGDTDKVEAWKKSGVGEGLGIAWDSATQAFGGYFCIVGMSLGLIIARYGVRLEPRKH